MYKRLRNSSRQIAWNFFSLKAMVYTRLMEQKLIILMIVIIRKSKTLVSTSSKERKCKILKVMSKRQNLNTNNSW